MKPPVIRVRILETLHYKIWEFSPWSLDPINQWLHGGYSPTTKKGSGNSYFVKTEGYGHPSITRKKVLFLRSLSVIDVYPFPSVS